MEPNEQLLSEALGRYGLRGPQAELIRHNENMTYKVTDGGNKYVLRIHKRVEGFTADIYDNEYSAVELIRSELEIIYGLRSGTNICMQAPVRGADGELVQMLSGGVPATLLEWVDGDTVENAGVTSALLWGSGVMMAKMHEFFARQKGIPYSRYNYDQATLARIGEKIEKTHGLGVITNEQSYTIMRALDEMRRRFDELDAMYEKHIVHADLGKTNVIIGDSGAGELSPPLTPIDFSLCGYSHYYMDIGGIYGLNYNDEGRRLIIDGYKSVRMHGQGGSGERGHSSGGGGNIEINPRYVEPYFALNILLFVACQFMRAKEWDWFPVKMEEWRKDVFQPLADHIAFMVI